MKDDEEKIPSEEIASRRDQTIKRMFAMPPKKHKDQPKQDGRTRGRPKKGDRD